MRTEKVAIIGLGVVGTGTLKILTQQRENIHEKTGVWIDVKKACDLNIDREFEFDFDKNILITDYNEIMEDDEISTVVELIGGYTVAKDIILKALNSGKNVVTANKALIAKYSKELFATAEKNGKKIYYEAAVGGGIPIVVPMQESLSGNRIDRIKGIINGTANYILTEMTEKGLDFGEVLKTAQELGYAEADPTFDVEGIDTSHKITILASLAFGGYVDFDKVGVRGISKITQNDIYFAKEFGYKIKLLAIAEKFDEEIDIRVEPTLIKEKEILANVNGVFNAVEVIGSYVGKTMYYGKGAGEEPTGSAVASDVIKLSKEAVSENIPEGNYFYNINNELKLKNQDEKFSRYFVRFQVKDKVGILAFISEQFKENNISIEFLKQTKREETEDEFVSLIIITHSCYEKNLKNAVSSIEKSIDIDTEKSIYLRIDE